MFSHVTTTTRISPLSLHDALPICGNVYVVGCAVVTSSCQGAFIAKFDSSGNEPWSHQFGASTSDRAVSVATDNLGMIYVDRKSTRLNSSHRCISYAVFCLKKKKH